MSLEEELKQDPSVSFWLKKQIELTDERDPIDALYDVEMLLEVIKLRVKKITVGYR